MAAPPGSTFGIIDNVVVSNLASAVSVSVSASPDTTSMDTTQPPGVFNLTRTGNTVQALQVGYTLSGTATNGVHYQSLPGTATFAAGVSSATLNVVAIPFTPAGPTRSVILTLNPSNTYSVFPPTSATVWIADTNKPSIHIAARDSQFYERTNDFARFTLTRWGDTNVYLSQVNVTYGGTATAGTQFYGEASTNMSYGVVTEDVHALPILDGMVTGPLTVTATVAAAGDNSYTVGTPTTSGPVTRVDADDPPETVLWSDDLHTDTSANWTQLFGTTNGAPYDATVNWAYDYYANELIPPAPHSGADTHGLEMTVNKGDALPVAAALNFYPKGQSFSGNYAFRFDMFLDENTSVSTTEYALFGINHDGTHTNWFRSGGVDPVGWNFDGIFYDVEADGAALGDYVGYSSPTTAAHNPTPITPGVSASSLTGVFKSPPWTPGAGDGGAAANVYGTLTPIWADVQIAQINGVIYWSINHTLIFAYTNTTAYTSGDVMLGYEDGYDSIGGSGGSVIYANARVISLAGPHITSIVPNGANTEISFTANAGDVVGQFVLQSAPAVSGPYADTSSTITSPSAGVFKAVKAASASPVFYRIRRVY